VSFESEMNSEHAMEGESAAHISDSDKSTPPTRSSGLVGLVRIQNDPDYDPDRPQQLYTFFSCLNDFTA